MNGRRKCERVAYDAILDRVRGTVYSTAVTSTYDLHKEVSVKAAFISEFQKETRTLLKYSQKIPATVPVIVLFKN